jgi:D-arabinose 1-dehydrogenase-like Zn-dependent alcohol dehydrogenase
VTAIDLAAAGRVEVTIDTRYPLEEIGTAIGRLQARQVKGRNVIVW